MTNTTTTQDIITFIREDVALYRALGFYLKYLVPGEPFDSVPLDWRFHENYNDPDYRQRFLAGDLVGVLATHIDRLVHCPDSIDEGRAQLVVNAVGGWVGLFDDVDEPVIPFDEYLALIDSGDVEQLETVIEQLPEGIDVESEIESVLERVAVIRGNAGYMKQHPSVLKRF